MPACRLTIPFATDVGTEADLEFTIRLETVECRLADRCKAVFDRDEMRRWISDPSGVLAIDEVTFLALTNGIAVSVVGVLSWRVISAAKLSLLLDRL